MGPWAAAHGLKPPLNEPELASERRACASFVEIKTHRCAGAVPGGGRESWVPNRPLRILGRSRRETGALEDSIFLERSARICGQHHCSRPECLRCPEFQEPGPPPELQGGANTFWALTLDARGGCFRFCFCFFVFYLFSFVLAEIPVTARSGAPFGVGHCRAGLSAGSHSSLLSVISKMCQSPGAKVSQRRSRATLLLV